MVPGGQQPKKTTTRGVGEQAMARSLQSEHGSRVREKREVLATNPKLGELNEPLEAARVIENALKWLEMDLDPLPHETEA